MGWNGIGVRGVKVGRCRRFDSHQINCLCSLFFFLILSFSPFHLFIFSSLLLFLFHSIILSSCHPIIFLHFYISIFHIRIFTYSHIFKKCSAHQQYEFRQKMFHRTKVCMKRTRYFLSVISVARLGLDWMWLDVIGCEGWKGWKGWQGWQGWQRSRIRFTSTQLYFFVFFCLICSFSSFHLFMFSCFYVFLFYPIILSYFYISSSHIHIFAYFQKCSAHEQYAFHHEDVSDNRMGYEPIQVFWAW
jgi:hypothetical protein